jgi:putative transposase
MQWIVKMKVKFKRDEKIIIGEKVFIIIGRLPNGDIQLRDSITNDVINKPLTFLIDQLFDGKLTIAADVDSNLKERILKQLKIDFTQLPEELRALTKRKYAYVNEVMTQKPSTLTERDLKPIITTVGKRLNDENPPSAISLYRWCKAYLSAGENFRVLIPRNESKGKFDDSDPEKTDARKTVSTEVIDHLETLTEEKYLTLQRISVQSLYDLLIAKIDDINTYRDHSDKLIVPHKSWVYRFIKALDPYLVALKRFGKRIADAKFLQSGKYKRPTMPLERVQLDHTKLDLMVVDPELHRLIGRPWLIVGIDVYTRVVWCVYVSYVPPSYLSLMQCFLHGIKPKNFIRELFPRIKHTWDVYGVPDFAVVDNAKENLSTHFEDAALQIGTIIGYAHKRRPQYKGSMERFFKSINTMLLHELPGTTFSNVLDKKDYDPAKNAIIDIRTFEAILYKWIVDVYLQGPHRGKGMKDTPAHKWAEAVKEFPPSVPSSKHELNVLLGMIVTREISRSGIEIEDLFYNDYSLSALKRSIGEKKVKVKFDPMDMSLVHVYDPFTGTWAPIPAEDQEYTKNLTLWQHRVNKKYVLEQLKRRVDIVGLAQAKAEIGEIVELSWSTTKKTQTRVKLAKYIGIGQEIYKVIDKYDSDSRNQEVTKPEVISMEGHGDALKGVSDIGYSVINDFKDESECRGDHCRVTSSDRKESTPKNDVNTPKGDYKKELRVDKKTLNTKGWKAVKRSEVSKRGEM